jgi:hypothetical protein
LDQSELGQRAERFPSVMTVEIELRDPRLLIRDLGFAEGNTLLDVGEIV